MSSACSDSESENERVAESTKSSKQAKRSKRIALLKAYRKFAKVAGFKESGNTVLKSLVTPLAVRKAIMKRVLSLRHPTYSKEEYERRHRLSMNPPSCKKASVIGKRVEPIVREVMREAVRSTLTAGRSTVDPYTIFTSIARVAPNLSFSYALPLGLVRHAQKTVSSRGDVVMSASEADVLDAEKEAMDVTKIKILAKTLLVEENKKKETRKRRFSKEASSYVSPTLPPLPPLPPVESSF